MKTLNLELVFDDTTEDLNIKITVRKGGEVDIKTLPPTSEPVKDDSNTGDGITKEKKSTAKKPGKKLGGNYMDAEF
jgi:hypothetical protein